ncbi:hypothetical protein AQ806_27780 [Burkholderia pseudomallei]|nr:hypothetical protein AQ806_27780 [Burkholderia pseudomallei]
MAHEATYEMAHEATYEMAYETTHETAHESAPAGVARPGSVLARRGIVADHRGHHGWAGRAAAGVRT